MKVKMKWQVTGLTYTAHEIAQASVLEPGKMVPTGKAVQEVRIEPIPFQEPSGPGEINPIPNNCQLPNSEFKFMIMNPEALGLEIFKPGQCVNITIEVAAPPRVQRG